MPAKKGVCNLSLNICRDEFDEEKEPDEMILSGWTEARAADKNNDIPTDNGASSSNVSQTVPLETEEIDEIGLVPVGKSNGNKRKASDAGISRKVEELGDDDDDDDIILMPDGNNSKKRKVQYSAAP